MDETKNTSTTLAVTYHEEVCEEDPRCGVLLDEDEVEDEADEEELHEGARDGVERLALDAQALREAEHDGQGDHGDGRGRLEHAHQEVSQEAWLPQVRLPRRRRQRLLQQRRAPSYLQTSATTAKDLLHS